MKIIPELSLNKHPQDATNNSLIYAKNVKLSNDISCLQNENSINANVIINTVLSNNNLRIKYLLPCNKELLVFSKTETNLLRIIRYNEVTSNYYIYESNIELNSESEINGTFTYNVNNDLIVSFSEYGDNLTIPLRTINLGRWNGNNIVYDSANIDKYKSYLCPEVNIPNISELNYITGRTYKGWYYFFIRYKINTIDYTQWFNFGYPIFVDNLTKKNIIKYHQYVTNDGKLTTSNGTVYSAGCSDFINNDLDICNESIQFDLNLDVRYGYYQIGYICAKNGSNKCLITNDIKINADGVNRFILNSKYNTEYSLDLLTTSNYNYYNVKNIYNYKNRLYISNYKEETYDNNALQTFANNIVIGLGDNTFIIDDIKNQLLDGTDSSNVNINIEPTTSLYYKGILINSDVKIEKDFNFKTDIYFISTINNISTRIYPSSYKTTTYPYNIIAFIFYFNIIVNNTKQEIEAKLYTTAIYHNLPYIEYNYEYLNYYRANTTCKTNNTTTITGTLGESIGKYVNNNDSFNFRKKNALLIPNQYYSFYIHFIDKYGISTNGYKINNCETSDNTTRDVLTSFRYFTKVQNINGEYIFKVPNTNFVYNTNNENKVMLLGNSLYINNNNTTLPNNIVGYYFSYEKFESINSINGVLCLYDNTTEDDGFSKKQTDVTNKMYFYSSEFDLLDKIDLNFNKLYVNKHITFESTESNNTQFSYNNLDFYTTLNITEKKNTTTVDNKEYDIQDLELFIGGNSEEGRIGLSTCLKMPIINELFQSEEGESSTAGYYKVYRATLYNDKYDNLYISKDKQLIRFGDIYTSCNNTIIDKGLNGHITYNNFLIYNANGVDLNTQKLVKTNNKERTVSSTASKLYWIGSESNIKLTKFVTYVQMIIVSDKFLEAKEFKNSPYVTSFISSKITSEEDTNAELLTGYFVSPTDSIDLFKLNYLSQDEYFPKYYTNYRYDITYPSEYNKTIRRSAVIADESSENNWRKFEVTEYRQISENKGIITNIIGIGNTLLVHTEHSLFAFSANRKLKNNSGEDIVASSSDIFDNTYQEIFTSVLGVCGLQDRKESIADEFGYYFFDKDANKFYKFSSEKIEEIDKDIIHFLDKYKPTKVRFGADKRSNRLLINITTTTINILISYNYTINKFISLHSYNFDECVNTKNILYLNYNNRLYNINYNELSNGNYNQFENSNETHSDSKIAIICNTEYEVIKALNSIKYKLYKIKNTNTTTDYNIFPVEEHQQPYSGDTIRVYNDIVTTGDLNISVNDTFNNTLDSSNYKKPYYDMGNWNFNYLFDCTKTEKTRIHGNYFIVLITFGTSITNRIELEDITFDIIKYR